MRLGEKSMQGKANKLHILGFLIILVAVLMLFPGFTGWITNMIKISIGIYPAEEACMYFISVPVNVTQDDETFFYILMENCGSLALNRTLTMEIKNSSMDTVDTLYSNYSLEPSRELGFNFTWLASYPLDTYTVFARDNITNETTEINASFDIFCSVGEYKCFGSNIMFCAGPLNWSFVESCSYMCVNGSCISAPAIPEGPAIGFGAPPLMASLDLEYPREINIQKGTNTTFFIKATNNGTALLHNVYLLLTSDELGLDIPDVVAPMLEPNSSVVFAITIESSKIPEGSYTTSFLVASNEISAKGKFTVSIMPVEEIDYQYLIDYYFSLIDYLEREIRDAELKGKNVSKPRELLLEAVEGLEAARRLLEMKLYPEFLGQTEAVRLKIVECVIALAKARPVPTHVIVMFPDYQTILYIVAIVIATALIVFFMMKKLKKWWRSKELFMPKKWGF